MIAKEVNFVHAKELLKDRDPDSFHIFPVTNPLGLVNWPVTQIHRAAPRFFMLEDQGKEVATLTLFKASETVLSLRGIAYTQDVSVDDWKLLFSFAMSNYDRTGMKKMYTIYKDVDKNIIFGLGFSDISGPHWTNEWKVFLAWKEL